MASTRYVHGDGFTEADHRAVAQAPPNPAGLAFATALEGLATTGLCCVPTLDLRPGHPTTIGLGDAFVGGFLATLAGYGEEPVSASAVDWPVLLDDGRVSRLEALVSVDEARRPSGDRALVLRLAGGLSLDVLPDRGLDIGAAWWRGVPIAWRSPHVTDPGPGRGWEDRFLGGLLATCGPDDIGPPRGTSGQHGSHHLTSAADVRWWRERTGDGVEVHVRGTVGHTHLYGPRVVVEREVVAATGQPSVEVRDVVRNCGDEAVGVPLLYHVNLGAPVLHPGARLLVEAAEPALREPCPPGRTAVDVPAPEPGSAAVVAEHRDVRAHDGWARAVLDGTGVGARLVVAWSAATLPRLCTWNWPARGAYVLGVEPTNAPLFGPERDLPHAGAPVLEPGRRSARPSASAWRSRDRTSAGAPGEPAARPLLRRREAHRRLPRRPAGGPQRARGLGRVDDDALRRG